LPKRKGGLCGRISEKQAFSPSNHINETPENKQSMKAEERFFQYYKDTDLVTSCWRKLSRKAKRSISSKPKKVK
jgi:hypothetical protein